jgi:plastocyanin
MKVAHLVGVVALAATAACSGSSTATGTTTTTPPAGATTVTIQDFTFTPANVTIKVGQTVFWGNNGPSAHTTVSDTGVWDSGTLEPPSGGSPGYAVDRASGGSFQFTFMTAGTYHYHCKIHPPSIYPAFVGTITVQ